MHKHYGSLRKYEPGPADVFDYNVGQLWLKGIDGARTTVAVIEGWNYPKIDSIVATFDHAMHLPNPSITTIYPSGDGRLPAHCPPGMVKLGGYGSCKAWAGELTLDVLSAHLMAPYAKILISATPADSQITDDPAAQVAPYEMMEALERISSQHLANVISISDGSAEASYLHGKTEITAQDPGELAAAAAGIPVLVATGDTGVVQTLPSFNGRKVTATPDSGTWDDSPWVTAVGGTLPNFGATGKRLGPDPLWPGESAGYSAVFRRPAYQNGVAAITGSSMRSLPDLAMDSSDGTSEAAPLLGGVLALATQLNHGRDVGPVNPVLYKVLGPRGPADGIVDVVKGNDSFVNHGKVVPGFTATRGFDVASGWGTISAPRFVPSLVAATRAAHEDRSARKQARAQLVALTRNLTLSHTTIAPKQVSYLLAFGFLPGHPVRMLIDGHYVAVVKASPLGYVTYTIEPALLKLAPGKHVLTLQSMLINESRSFRST
jgi:subtilase family serine protease